MDSARQRQLEALQEQVGTVDALESLRVAYSTNGWLGGMDRVKFILMAYPAVLWEHIEQIRFRPDVASLPVQCSVLTGQGPRQCVINDGEYAFGGDVRSQFIGLTLCALAHECAGIEAQHLFTDDLGEHLFEDLAGARTSLTVQLQEDRTRILNEGAARGLTHRFRSAVASLGSQIGNRTWLREIGVAHDVRPSKVEVAMLGGLLKWIATRKRGTYFTRSARVTRAAACLKVVGYPIGPIQTWVEGDDADTLPSNDPDEIPVVLVLHGSRPYDPLQMDVEDIEEVYMEDQKLHYGYHTVGEMVVEAFHHYSDLQPKVVRAEFERIHRYFQSKLQISFVSTGHMNGHLAVHTRWVRGRREQPSGFEKIASIFFPRSAAKIGPCYRAMGDPELYEQLMDDLNNWGSDKRPFSASLAMFRALTVAIIIAFAARLAPKDFETTPHCTAMELDMAEWLNMTCWEFDSAMSTRKVYYSRGVRFDAAMYLLAVVHAGAEPDKIEKTRAHGVGWRHGTYTVVPSLVIEMAPVSEAVGLQCLDAFVGNIGQQDTGAICDPDDTPPIETYDDVPEADDGINVDLTFLTGTFSRRGQSVVAPPDVALSLSIGQSEGDANGVVSIRGHVEGVIIGSVGLRDTLMVIAESYEKQPAACSHTSQSGTAVVNVPASIWKAQWNVKPVSRRFVAYVPVQGDAAWAVFLAGQARYLPHVCGRIVFRCIPCAMTRSSWNVYDGAVGATSRIQRIWQDDVGPYPGTLKIIDPLRGVGPVGLLIGYHSQ